MERRRAMILAGVAVLAVVTFLIFVGIRLSRPRSPLPQVRLSDGRILQIEAVTFGTRHKVGRRFLLESFSPWLPGKLTALFSPKYPRSEIQSDRPGLVIWVDARDATTGKYVDCQGVRVEIRGEGGDVFAPETSSWFGGNTFWREGHIFYAFPRSQATLTVQITPVRKPTTVQLQVPNPHVIAANTWSGQPPPLHKVVGDLDVGLIGLQVRTNGSPARPWETVSRYWLPVWEVRRAGQVATGWEPPEWVAEDATGNRSQFLGLHQPVLRFSAKFYPNPTNSDGVVLLTNSPPITLSGLQSNVWWNLDLSYNKRPIHVLGLFTNGVHVFLNGAYQTNPPVQMSPVRGGAPSGWVGQSQRVSPTKVNNWEGHYTPVPVIYLQAEELGANERLALTLRDDEGRSWPTKPESQRNGQNIQPFLLELPSEVKTITAEFVVLRAVEADFLVQTPATQLDHDL